MARPLARPRLEVADIFRRHGPAWRNANAGHVSLGQLKAMSAIESCRTAALGGHVARCDDCAHIDIAYNSCLMGKFRNGELEHSWAGDWQRFRRRPPRRPAVVLRLSCRARRSASLRGVSRAVTHNRM